MLSSHSVQVIPCLFTYWLDMHVMWSESVKWCCLWSGWLGVNIFTGDNWYALGPEKKGKSLSVRVLLLWHSTWCSLDLMSRSHGLEKWNCFILCVLSKFLSILVWTLWLLNAWKKQQQQKTCMSHQFWVSPVLKVVYFGVSGSGKNL